MFIFSSIFSLEKYTRTKPELIVLILVAGLSTISLSFLSVYLLLKFSSFIPLYNHVPVFAVSFFVGGTLWVIYARVTIEISLACRVDGVCPFEYLRLTKFLAVVDCFEILDTPAIYAAVAKAISKLSGFYKKQDK